MGTGKASTSYFPSTSIERFSDDSFSHYGEELSDFVDAVGQIGLARIIISVMSRGLRWLRRQTCGVIAGFLIAENRDCGLPRLKL